MFCPFLTHPHNLPITVQNAVERSLRKRASDAEAALAAAEQQVIYKKPIEVSLGPNDFYYYYYYYY